MTSASSTTIDPNEAAHFDAMAGDWWDPAGSSAMLHRLNPVRLAYIRAQIDRHWAVEPRSLEPLTGKSVLDVGCGGGLLCEPLARMGAAVTGIDAAPEAIAVAERHAERSGLAIEYRPGGIEVLEEQRYDMITCLEVIEHVALPATFVRGLSRVLADGGVMILSTPNRTRLSQFAMIGIAEGFGRIPKGTHDWKKFITPEELAVLLASEGLGVDDMRGIAYSPLSGFALGRSTALNYIVTVTRD